MNYFKPSFRIQTTRFLIALLFPLCLKTSTIAQQPASKTVYLFCYFKNNGEDGLHLAGSRDGYTWIALHGDSSVLKPTI